MGSKTPNATPPCYHPLPPPTELAPKPAPVPKAPSDTAPSSPRTPPCKGRRVCTPRQTWPCSARKLCLRGVRKKAPRHSTNSQGYRQLRDSAARAILGACFFANPVPLILSRRPPQMITFSGSLLEEMAAESAISSISGTLATTCTVIVASASPA